MMGERFRCEVYAVYLSRASCAKRRERAAESWAKELESRRKYLRIDGRRSHDRGEFSACRACPIGAANLEAVRLEVANG